jgi:hypothetical protein
LRARVPIIEARYELTEYYVRYESSIKSLIVPSAGSKTTSFVIPAEVIRPAF